MEEKENYDSWKRSEGLDVTEYYDKRERRRRRKIGAKWIMKNIIC